MCRLIVDTNVLLDALVDGRPHAEASQGVIDRCCGWGDYGMVCGLSLKDVYYITARARGERWARNAVRHLMDNLVIAPVDAEVCELALTSREPDFEDGIIRACAELNGAEFIITHDKSAYAYSSIRSVTAAEYLEIAHAHDKAKGEDFFADED